MASTTIVKYMSPKGTFEWVTISGEGKEDLSGRWQYLVTLILTKEQRDIISAELDAYWDANRPKHIKVPKSRGIKKHMIKTDETDEDGVAIKKHDGTYYIQFKSNIAWPDGSPNVIKVYNAKGKSVQLGTTKVGNGTVGKVAGAYDMYYVKSKKGQVVDAGITFYLNGIQISKLVEATDEIDFEADEEGGWQGDDDSFESVNDSAEDSGPSAGPSAGPRL